MKNIYILVLYIIATNSAFCQNDSCSNAIEITPSPSCNYITGTFSGSSITGSVPDCAAGSLQDVWYKFVATSTTMNVTLATNNNLNLAFEIIGLSCTGNSLVCVNNTSIPNGEIYTANNFNLGQVYYVRVFNNTGNISTANFKICIKNTTLGSNNFDKPIYTIHPNPAQIILNIKTQETIKEVAVYDMLGKKITINQLSTNSIDVSTLAQGLYLIKLVNKNDKIFSSKFIKE